MGVWLTEKFVREQRPPASGSTIVYDAPDPKGKAGWVSGFGLRLSSGGARSFVLTYRNKSRQSRRLTIGQWPVWSVEAARSEAKETKFRISRGADPLAEIKAERDAPTMSELCERFVADFVPRKRPATQRNYRAIAEIIKAALGRKQVAAVNHSDIEKLHSDISPRAPLLANRVVACSSRMFTLAMKWKMRGDNPAKGIERNPEARRTRYLMADELARLTKALAEHDDQQAANVFRMLLLTGARKGEVLSARWDQFDFERNVWVKPGATTKQKTEHEVPLGNAALALLATIRKHAPESAYLFPSDSKSGHLVEVKKGWAVICERAGIAGLRVHDLRHSFASELVSAGYSLPLIGSLLGHTTPGTTARYAHLFDEVKREATNKIGARMAGLVAKPNSKRKLRVV